MSRIVQVSGNGVSVNSHYITIIGPSLSIYIDY